MIVVPDDVIYRVDQVFLGPDRVRLPWRWTYRQYGVGVATFIVSTVLQRQLGFGFSLVSLGISGMLMVWATRLVHEKVSWDRPIKVVVKEFRLELDGPRERLTPWGAVLAVKRGRAQRRAFQAFPNTAQPHSVREPVPPEYVAHAPAPPTPHQSHRARRVADHHVTASGQ